MMKRLRCGETTCIHHKGDCIAREIEVRSFEQKPQCFTYVVSPAPNEKAQQNTEVGSEQFDIDTLDLWSAEDQAVPEKTGFGKITCAASECYYNHDNTCRSPWLSFGLPGKKGEVNAECTSYVPN